MAVKRALISPLVDYFLSNNMAKPYADIEGDESKSVYVPFTTIGNANPQVQKAIYFAPDNDLDYQNSIITAIEFVPEETNQRFYNGSNAYVNNIGIATNPILSGVLYISNLQREIIATLPLTSLIRRLNNGKITFTYFTNVVWQNCYVEFTDITGLNATKGMQFNVYYKPNPNKK